MSLAAPTAGQRRVFLHVGAPKTGTTFLQDVLWTNRAALVEAGVCYPLRRADEHFAATMDLRQMAWGRERDPQWEGAWERIAARVRAWPGPTAVISNELLGGASAEQVAAAVASLAPAQVHVVFTARDLARQLPSDWQEHLKHLHVVPFDRFVEDLVELGTAAPAPFGEMFWRLHDPVDVLDRWVSAVPAAHVHLVTVPQPDAPTGLLWERFAAILGLDPAAFDTNVGRSNTSLGVVDCELLRRVNRHLRGKIDLRPRPHAHPVRLRNPAVLRQGVGRRIAVGPDALLEGATQLRLVRLAHQVVALVVEGRIQEEALVLETEVLLRLADSTLAQGDELLSFGESGGVYRFVLRRREEKATP